MLRERKAFVNEIALRRASEDEIAEEILASNFAKKYS
jgi:hypothetical protein